VSSEAAARADFSLIRYGQCWEDADVLLEGLAVRDGDSCLSIASAGDNTLALLTARPARVVAVDLSPAQLACLELRVAAFRELRHEELLELLGSRPSTRRGELYGRCRRHLSAEALRCWDARPDEISAGAAGAGKFERYFALFRQSVLPWIHPRSRVADLLRPKPTAERERFYRCEWDTWRWRLLFRVFFSRFVMGRAGRDPTFFRFVEGSVSQRILARTRHALTALEPAENPYLRWILTGCHGVALPLALRPESFDPIRDGIDRLEWHCVSLEDYLDAAPEGSFDRFNLSDVFEYVSPEASSSLLERLARAARPGGRLAYWNMLVPRSRPPELAERLRPQERLAADLHLRDKAFFYSRFVLEEVR